MERDSSPLSEKAAPPSDASTIRAVGHFAALLLTVLHREQVLDMREFADHLANFATITGETDPPARMAMAYWAGVLREAAHET
ncbi:hypothetical protein NS226_08080 [Aureimonas ureilytica]|uniref:Uncharacterized protein n=1 Tax=Aureimonas ureilytica TaxID=401562 RepID=A0A175RAQ0_9HYPH|nr:hypothetical protein [Aureimonas ureilytica]KTQ96320.1 hypothetical protein NS226_08080 [Aureimonas ureilytica]